MSNDDKRIIVCGGGFAGLSAAITALQAGAKVTLIEKSPAVGGTAAFSGGLIWTFADFDVLRAKLPDGDPALQWLVFDTIDESRDWLQSLGVKVGPMQVPVLEHGRGQSIEPAQMIETLAKQFAALGGELLLDTALESLICTGGVVCGARILRDGRITELRGGAVILATGGFQGNHELVGRYIVNDPDNLTLRANPWSTGEGFIAATAMGAAASPGLDNFYGHALTAPPARFTKFQFRDVTQYQGCLAVALNLDGVRFADETSGPGEEVLNQQLARQRRGRGVYIVDDETLDLHPAQGRETITRTILARARSVGGTVIEADTLEELCAGFPAIGIPAERALASLREFNAAMENGHADTLKPGRERHRKPLLKPPFHAVAVKAAITFTMGGLQIDERARVLWRAGGISPFAPVPDSRAYADTERPVVAIGTDYRQTPIRGLYAAGSDVGNISHFGYMGGLGPALTTGRAAGTNAARLVQSSTA